MIKHMNPNKKQSWTVKKNHRSQLLGLSLVLAFALVSAVLLGMRSPGWAAPLATRPTLTLIATPDGGSTTSPEPLLPGTVVTFVFGCQNRNAGAAATGSYMRAQIPITMELQSVTPAADITAVVDNSTVLTWDLESLAGGATQVVTLTTKVKESATLLLGRSLPTFFDADIGGETGLQKKEYYYVGPAGMGIDTETSVSLSGNTAITEVVAGEIVTTTVVFTVPQGTRAYSFTPYVQFQDGISPTIADPEWVVVKTSKDRFDQRGISDGYEMRFATIASVDASAAAQVYTYVISGQVLPAPAVEVSDPPFAHEDQLEIKPFFQSADCGEQTCDPAYYLEEEPYDSAPYYLTFLRPEVDPLISYSYPDAPGVGRAGGEVQFDIPNTNSTDHPPAYDMVLTVTVPTELAIVTVSPATVSQSISGGKTYLRWENVSLASGADWPVQIDATLPNPLPAGTVYTVTSVMYQETYAGDRDYEGVYVDKTDVITLTPGLSEKGLLKSVEPGTVTIGDVVTYTVVLTQGAGIAIENPVFSDTLPLGFHYVDDSLVVTGIGVTNTQVLPVQTNAQGNEVLVWTMDTIPGPVTQQAIEMVFLARLTGKYGSKEAYVFEDEDPAEDIIIMDDDVTALNHLEFYAMSGGNLGLVKSVDGGQNLIYQPWLDIKKLDRTQDYPLEIGINRTDFTLDVQNDGEYPAYDVVICDQLPDGIFYVLDLVGSAGLSAASKPTNGDSGEVCWSFSEIQPGSAGKKSIKYEVEASKNTALPGYPLTNYAYAKEYSSQPGSVFGERLYHEIPAVVADADTSYTCSKNCPYYVLGMELVKYDNPNPVRAGAKLTYTLRYTNTSTVYGYSDIVVSDTYDSNLSFVSANPAPDNTASNPLIWSTLSDPAATSQDIILVMEVISPAEGIKNVVNHYSWYSTADAANGQQPEREWSITTTLSVPSPQVSFTDPVTTRAGIPVTYTIVYSNTGTGTGADAVSLSFDFDPYLTDSWGKISGAAVADDSTGRTFSDSLSPGESHTLVISRMVEAPLPYDVSELNTTVLAYSPGANEKEASITTNLLRPIFELSKEPAGADVAPNIVDGLLQYAFVLQNDGTYTATNCVITDSWDSGLYTPSGTNWNVIAGTDTATYTTGLAMIGLGDAPAIDKLTLQAEAVQDSYINTIAIACDQVYGQMYTRKTWGPSIETYKEPNDVIAFPGRVLSYTIAFTNTASGAVENAVITDHLPSNITAYDYTKSAPVGCSGFSHGTVDTPSGVDIYWKCEFLSADADNKKLYVWGTVSGTEGTVFTNTTETDGKDPVPARPGEVEVVSVISRPRLEIVKTPYPTHPVAPGAYITYTFVYTNYGTADALGVEVVDTLDADVDFDTCAPAGICSEAGGVVTWDIGELAAGESGELILVVKVKDGTDGEQVDNDTFTISSQRLATDDSDTLYTYPPAVLILATNLDLVKSAQPTQVGSDLEPVTYTLHYQNTGGGPLHNVVIVDDLSTDNQLVPDNLAAQNCAYTGNLLGAIVSCDLGTLEQGAEGDIIIQVLANIGEGEQMANMATGEATELTAAKESNTVTVEWPGVCPDVTVDSFVRIPAGTVATGTPVNFVASASGGTINNYRWDFGDGVITDTGTTTVIAHTYTYSNTFTATVTATNSCGNSDSSQLSVVVEGETLEPVIAVDKTSVLQVILAGDPLTPTQNLTISNDGNAPLTWSLAENPAEDWLTPSSTSGSIAANGDEVVALDFDAQGLAYGDYRTDLVITSNDVANSPLTIPVTLTVSSSTCIAIQSVDFDFTPTAPAVGQAVTFNATILPTAATPPISYTWDFGAGPVAAITASTIQHTFTTSDTYSVSVSAVNQCTSPAVTISKNVVVVDAGYNIYLPLLLKDVVQ